MAIAPEPGGKIVEILGVGTHAFHIRITMTSPRSSTD